MAEKLTLTAYLARRGVKAKALTRGEAMLLGIPYPLQCGWPRKYGSMEIDGSMLQQLATHADAARQVAKEKARAKEARSHATASAGEQLPLISAPARIPVSPVAGFVLRRARRYA